MMVHFARRLRLARSAIDAGAKHEIIVDRMSTSAYSYLGSTRTLPKANIIDRKDGVGFQVSSLSEYPNTLRLHTLLQKA